MVTWIFDYYHHNNGFSVKQTMVREHLQRVRKAQYYDTNNIPLLVVCYFSAVNHKKMAFIFASICSEKMTSFMHNYSQGPAPIATSQWQK